MPMEARSAVDQAIEEVLGQLRPVESAEALSALLASLEAALGSYVTEVMAPDQSLLNTTTELKDLFVLLWRHRLRLAEVEYGDGDLSTFRDAIVALLTVDGVFGQRLRLGDWQPRPLEEVLRASLPWREKLRRKASQAFFLDEARLGRYQDHNESGSLDEEVADLNALVEAARRDLPALARKGFTQQDVAEGARLLAEAQGRDVLAVAGIRGQAELKLLRDRLLTLAVRLGRYGRVVGMSAFWNDPATSAAFERISFRNALRRIHPRRRSRVEAPAEAGPTSDGGSDGEPAAAPAAVAEAGGSNGGSGS